mmetsp:Transcript_8390/g.13605  ORF Transcript_8390/g.13605 Transcript_8390/m.13605 type:complete len:229 (+) Transcript_8390:3-689(+)
MSIFRNTITSATVIFNYQDTQEGDSDANDNPQSSATSSIAIGDVVQNLHGGKYQFSETQYLAGGSVMGQQFAESLYSSGGGVDETENDGVDDELPKWALRLQNSFKQSAKPVMTTLAFDKEKSTHSISIKNDERSWERYHVFLLPTTIAIDDDDLCCFRVSPTTGSLAPRGGASNICDETKPYSDSAVISIEWLGEDDMDVGAAGEKEWLLVVGTEAEVWRYRLSIIA